jgi:hypothetical protein
MTKKSVDIFIELCDLLCVQPFYTSAANILGVEQSTIFRWIQASQRNPEEYTFVWSDCSAALHVHVRSAMRINAHLIESQARRMALEGFEEPVFFQGRPQWKEREDLVGVPDDELELFYGVKDRWERDENGNRIQLTVRHRPTDALVLKILAAAFPKVYGTNVEHNVTHGGHVMIVGAGKAVKPVAAATPIIEAEAVPALPAPAEDRLAAIRQRMMADAEKHLSDPSRVTQPRGVVQKFPGGPDSEIHDGPPVASRAQPRSGVEPQPPKRPAPYARQQPAPGNGVQSTGVGPDPTNVGGVRGFNMNSPQSSGPRRTL